MAQELANVARLQAERDANPILAGALQRVASWQGRRLRMTYEDLAAQPRYADAVLFFQTDLYGSAEFARRDADLARIVPMMVRMLPERVLATVAKAVELHALSQGLDRSLLGGCRRRRPIQRRRVPQGLPEDGASAPSANARSASWRDRRRHRRLREKPLLRTHCG